jgi:hypothetical protein
MHSHSLRFFHFMQSYNTYDLSPLLSFLSLAFLPRRQLQGEQNMFASSVLCDPTQKHLFLLWERQKKGALSDEGARKKALGLWEGDDGPVSQKILKFCCSSCFSMLSRPFKCSVLHSIPLLCRMLRNYSRVFPFRHSKGFLDPQPRESAISFHFMIFNLVLILILGVREVGGTVGVGALPFSRIFIFVNSKYADNHKYFEEDM